MDATLRRFRSLLPRAAKYAGQNGWALHRKSGKHPFLLKGKFKYFLSGSPSDRRADLNVLRDLTRYDATGEINGTQETSQTNS